VPRITAGSVTEHREQVRRRVFDAFAALMSEHSFDAISMAQIAAAAEIGRTAIYHHFPDKEAVVVAFAGHETESYLAALRGQLEAATSAPDRLRAYVRHHLASGEDFHAGLGPRLYGVLPESSRAAIREHVVDVERVLREVLTGGVESGDFEITDLDATVALVHACLAPRDLAPGSVEQFVLRAVSAS